jgi:hypothetical protein
MHYHPFRQIEKEIEMSAMAMGDFYVWYCEWCDSRNLTPWVKPASGKISCGCCHKEYATVDRSRLNEGRVAKQQSAFF